MSVTDSPPDLLDRISAAPADSRRAQSPGTSDDPDAIIAALDDAEVAVDPDEGPAGRLPDSSADVIEILDAEPILAEEGPLSGAPDPIDVTTKRAKNETARDRIVFFEKEEAKESRKPYQAVLQHEIGVQIEGLGHDDTEVTRAYAQALTTEPGLRPNLWALRRIFDRRGLYPSVQKLLDTEARFAPTKHERADVWTEKGHLLEDLFSETEEAIVCYRTAHELDPGAIGPLSALEKLLTRRGDSSGRPSGELLDVYRKQVAATHEPGRRVALLIELARYEEDLLRSGEATGGGDLDRVLSYLHEAYDAGIDQLRVVDEIVRVTAAFGRIPDCLAALDVKAEILELQAEQASPQRQALLGDQIIAIRRQQTALARDRMHNAALAWQYLEKAHQLAPGDPLVLPDLLALADAQGRYEQLAELLLILEEQKHIARGDETPALGLWLKRALALRQAGADAAAEELEQRIAEQAPSHLLLFIGQERRAIQQRSLPRLAELFIKEAQAAEAGLTDGKGEKKPDPLWATDAWLRAAICALRSGDSEAARSALGHAARTLGASDPSPRRRAHERLLAESFEELYLREKKWTELARFYEERLSAGLWQSDPTEARRLAEALVDLYQDALEDPARAEQVLSTLIAAAPDDLRLRLRAVELSIRRKDAARTAVGLHEVAQAEQRAGLGGPRPADLLRRAELLAQSGDETGAVVLYEEVLRLAPGEPQALAAIEQLLRRTGRLPELPQVLRKQIDSANATLGRGSLDLGSEAGQRLLSLQAALADVLDHELSQGLQAISVHRAVVERLPGYVPALRALLRLHRQQQDLPKQLSTLNQLGEAAPAGPARAAFLQRLGELLEETQSHRPEEADAAYAGALQTLPLPSPLAAHAALGRLRMLMRKRSYGGLSDVLDSLGDSVLPDEPNGPSFSALLSVERAALALQAGTGLGIERAEGLLSKATQDLRQAEAAGSVAHPELATLIELARWRLSEQREDGKLAATALAGLAVQVAGTSSDSDAWPVASELYLRAGLLGMLCEDEPSQQVEAARRLLAAYRLLGNAPQVVVPLTDLLEDPSILEALAREPELITVLRARQAICPETATADRVFWLLTEADLHLLRGEGEGVEEATRIRCAEQAAEAAYKALALDPQSLPALLVLRHTTALAPTDLEGSEAVTDPAQVARLRAAAAYALRLAAALRQPEPRVELYTEAAQIFQRLGETETAAAALRTVLDCDPFDTTAFSRLQSLLSTRAEDPQTGDAGPLLELLSYRLSQVPSDEAHRKLELPQRLSLLLQRAALYQAAGQTAEAVQDLETLLKLDAAHAQAQRRLAELLAQRGEGERAIEHYEKFLALDPSPADRQAAHVAVARLLSESAPSRAVPHLEQAVELGKKTRALRGDEVDTVEEIAAEAQLYRWLVELQLAVGKGDEAVATFRSLLEQIPTTPPFTAEREKLVLALATVLEKDRKEPAAALELLGKELAQRPLAISLLERLAALSNDKPAGFESAATKAIDEARRNIVAFGTANEEGELPAIDAAPWAALAQIFALKNAPDARSLAAQAAAVIGGGASTVPPPPLKLPGRSVGPPLRSAAFPAAARGVLFELWTEIQEGVNKLYAPDLTAVGSGPKERLNAKEVPAVWSTVDQLAQRFGLGGSGSPYGLYLSREREKCVIAGTNLVCGSSFSSKIGEFPPALYARLLRQLALLPDRLGPVDGELAELVLLFAACCQLAQIQLPTLAPEQRSRLDERTRSLDRALSRKERSALRSLAPRLGGLAGDAGRDLIAEWQLAVRLGSAQLSLAISGNVQATLSDLGVGPRDASSGAARLARGLLAWSASAELVTLRRELGVSE